ncbi:methyltransferase domain-containing protein [Thermobifida halotolerans]|uniref:methyltransferase domain-containing protein n=1 Tax=Thermobifida halotolerans TaxID=483545 RepID=UPI003519A2D2
MRASLTGSAPQLATSRPSVDPEADSAAPRPTASHFASADSPSVYWRFYWAVAAAQLTRWLPREPGRLLDLSGPGFRGSSRAVAAGHDVVALLPSVDAAPKRTLNLVNEHAPVRRNRRPGRLRSVVGDSTLLSGFASEVFDGVIADNRVLSQHLVTEASLTEIARVLRPGGRTLLCVDSVVLGMAVLAEQDCWPELSYAPNADVLLVPWPDGAITRCFTGEQLGELLTEAGLELEWIKPRTVLSASTVEKVLGDNPRALNRLVEMELKAADSGDDVSMHLLASARKPG